MSWGNANDRQKAYKEYMAFRRNQPKKDVTFLDRQRRNCRICTTEEELTPFVDGIEALADAAAKEGRKIRVALDVETEFVDPKVSSRKEEPFFWHKRKLRKEGVDEEELRRREEAQAKLAEKWSKKSSKAKRNQKEEYRRACFQSGLVKSDAYAFQMACVEDVSDEFTFAAHTTKISDNSFGGDAAMPSCVMRLFQHPAIIWINVGIHGDLTLMNDSFFGGQLTGMRYVDLTTVFESATGKRLRKDPKFSDLGALGIFQRAHEAEGYTWRKSPLLGRSHWWGPWTPDQEEYALMDPNAVVMVVRKIEGSMDVPLESLTAIFPATESGKQTCTTSNVFKCAVGGLRATTNAFEYELSDEDCIILDSGPTSVADPARVERDRQHFEEENRRRAIELAKHLERPPVIPDSDEDWNAEVDEDEDDGEVAGSGPVWNNAQPQVISLVTDSESMGDDDVFEDDDAAVKEDAVGDMIDIDDIIQDADDASISDTEVTVRQVEISAEPKSEDERISDPDYFQQMVFEPIDEDCMNEVIEGGASPSELRREVQVASSSLSHVAAVAEDVEEVVQEEDLQPLVGPNRIAKKIASILKASSRRVNFRGIEKILPPGRAPETMAEAAMMMKDERGRAKSNYVGLLKFLSTRWNNEEKLRFLDEIGDVDPCITHPKVVEYLGVRDADMRLILAESIEVTVACLKIQPGRVEPFLQFLSKLYGSGANAKVEESNKIAKESGRRSAYFMRVSIDARILATVKAISRAFFVEIPIEIRRRFFQERIVDIGEKIYGRKMGFSVGVKLINFFVDRVAGDRRTALDVMNPYGALRAHFAAEWFGEDPDCPLLLPPVNALPPPAPLVCPADRFHGCSPPIFQVVTLELAISVVERLKGVDDIAMAFRATGDLRYDDQSVGVIGFSARRSNVVHVLFPNSHPGPSQMVASAMKRKRVHCVNATRVTERLGNGFQLVELDEARRRGEKNPTAVGVHNILRCMGVDYCQNHFYDATHSPEVIEGATLTHLAAEVHFLASATFDDRI